MAKKDYEMCQIATPVEYAQFMLKIAEYTTNVYDSKILENSCGGGNVLCEVVRVFIEQGLLEHTKEEVKNQIQKNLCGIELDKNKIDECVKKLNNIASEYDIYDVKWNIINTDFLSYNISEKYDYIIGNPPYISYKNLSNDSRDFCKQNFKSCKKGKFDYCYAFIEKSINSLSKNGKLVYLIPSSIFKNVFAEKLRSLLLRDIIAIYDNFEGKVFEHASVSPSIFLYQDGCNTTKIEYCDCNHNGFKYIKKLFDKSKLEGKWVFEQNDIDVNNKIKLGDIFIIGNSIATLSNECFLIKNYCKTEYDNILKTGEYKLERELLKDAVSANSINNNKKYKIIFPYRYDEQGKLIRYSSDEFEKKFPFTYQYLLTKKDKLDERTSDHNTSWFEYGRSQALRNMNKKKLMISIMVTDKVNVYQLDKDTIPYSGIYIIQKDTKYTLSYAKRILESPSFLKYIRSIGISSEGKAKRITCNDVKNFKF